MQYRKEIDGLRAIAVLSVVLFHGGIWGLSGGYVGVDIFFVISGYLITSIILEEKEKGQFSIINFYERRARRILPALTLVLAITTCVAYLLMPADILKLYSQGLISVMAFSSNVFFFLKSGYFSADADENPLIHTWSLAVEEQFYLFFPVMIILFWPLGRKYLIFSIALIASLSLLFAQFLLSENAFDANFYLIFSRAWELLFGAGIALLSLYKIHEGRLRRELMSLFGFVLIVYSMVFFDERTPFPSVYALIPVLGTCLIIVFTDEKSICGRFLSHKILVSIGLISYSLYLWHQPLFAFLRLKSVGEPSNTAFIGAILLAFFLAFLSWKYVEQPFRNKLRYTPALVFKLSAISIAIFLVLGFTGHFYKGFAKRFDLSAYSDSIQYSPMRDKCHTKGRDYLAPSDACQYFGDKVSWASFGDSHVVEPSYALARRLEANNIGLVHLSFSGCPPVLSLEVKEAGCGKWLKASLDYLKKNKRIENVLLGFRYSGFLYGDQLDAYPALPDIDPAPKFLGAVQGLDAEDLRAVYWEGLKKIISTLLASGKTVHILYPIPELPLDIKKAVMPFSVLGDRPLLNLEKATSAEYYFSRNEFILRKLDSLPFGENLRAIKPFEMICQDQFCPAVIADKALYFDDNHLSVPGAELIVKNISIEHAIQKKD